MATNVAINTILIILFFKISTCPGQETCKTTLPKQTSQMVLWRLGGAFLQIFRTQRVTCSGRIASWTFRSANNVSSQEKFPIFSVWEQGNNTRTLQFGLVGATSVNPQQVESLGGDWYRYFVPTEEQFSVDGSKNQVLGVFYEKLNVKDSFVAVNYLAEPQSYPIRRNYDSWPNSTVVAFMGLKEIARNLTAGALSFNAAYMAHDYRLAFLQVTIARKKRKKRRRWPISVTTTPALSSSVIKVNVSPFRIPTGIPTTTPPSRQWVPLWPSSASSFTKPPENDDHNHHPKMAFPSFSKNEVEIPLPLLQTSPSFVGAVTNLIETELPPPFPLPKLPKPETRFQQPTGWENLYELPPPWPLPNPPVTLPNRIAPVETTTLKPDRRRRTKPRPSTTTVPFRLEKIALKCKDPLTCSLSGKLSAAIHVLMCGFPSTCNGLPTEPPIEYYDDDEDKGLTVTTTTTTPSTTVVPKCPSPILPANSQMASETRSEYNIGTSLEVSCKPGFLFGKAIMTCGQNATWSQPDLTCKLPPTPATTVPTTTATTRRVCGKLPEFENGMPHQVANGYLGEKIYYDCEFGYNLVDNDHVTCNGTGNWTGTITCQPGTISCYMPLRVGTCSDVIPRWYFDRGDKVCKPFWYSGCGGNANRFDSELQCINRCGFIYAAGTNV